MNEEQIKENEMTDVIEEAIKQIERDTCFRMTAMVDDNSAFFVPVAANGKTVIGECFHLTRSKILKLAELNRERKR